LIKGVIGIKSTEQNNKVMLNFKETIKLAYFYNGKYQCRCFLQRPPYLLQEGGGDIVFSDSKGRPSPI
jgi:hypothetical protein